MSRPIHWYDYGVTADESIAALKELLLAKIAAVEDTVNRNDTLYTERDVSRRTAVEAALKASQIGIEAAFAASEKATSKSDINAEKWRENANEWRAAMMDREIKFAPRTEVDNELRNLRTEMVLVKENQDQGKGKGEGIGLAWAVALAVVGLLLAYGFTRPVPLAPYTPPQVIYVPAPPNTMIPSTPPAPTPR